MGRMGRMRLGSTEREGDRRVQGGNPATQQLNNGGGAAPQNVTPSTRLRNFVSRGQMRKTAPSGEVHRSGSARPTHLGTRNGGVRRFTRFRSYSN